MDKGFQVEKPFPCCHKDYENQRKKLLLQVSLSWTLKVADIRVASLCNVLNIESAIACSYEPRRKLFVTIIEDFIDFSLAFKLANKVYRSSAILVDVSNLSLFFDRLILSKSSRGPCHPLQKLPHSRLSSLFEPLSLAPDFISSSEFLHNVSFN